MATRGWIHPELALGFEVVTATLLGGMADRERVRMIDAGEGPALGFEQRMQLVLLLKGILQVSDFGRHGRAPVFIGWLVF